MSQIKLFHEAERELNISQGDFHQVLHEPALSHEPVMTGSTDEDGGGVTVYGGIIKDGGRFRMWYQALPRGRGFKRMSLVGYAESDDGLNWERPVLNSFEVFGSKRHNICNLGLHCPSVFIDPDAPPSHRYRATGCGRPGDHGGRPEIEIGGYYSAHSADGIDWTLDQGTPRWHSCDVITSMYHPGQKRGVASLKYMPHIGGRMKRSVWSAALEKGEWSDAKTALVPDEYDDICAVARGFRDGDYYGMSMMPVGEGTVGFLWNFRRYNFLHGSLDMSLVYQSEKDARWMHTCGRKSFIEAGATSWGEHGYVGASYAMDMGDRQRLYISGLHQEHGASMVEQSDGSFQVDMEDQKRMTLHGGHSSIGYAEWPKNRLMGMCCRHEGVIKIQLDRLSGPRRLYLNYRCEDGGEIKVELETPGKVVEGRDGESCRVLSGDELEHCVSWKGGDIIDIPEDTALKIRLYCKRVTLYSFELR